MIDFAERFDRIRRQFISEQCVSPLMKLYNDQCAPVFTDVESENFHVAGGTKQGDLLRSLLFNSVLLVATEKDKESSRQKELGI